LATKIELSQYISSGYRAAKGDSSSGDLAASLILSASRMSIVRLTAESSMPVKSAHIFERFFHLRKVADIRL
jgi:hypothetical protein